MAEYNLLSTYGSTIDKAMVAKSFVAGKCSTQYNFAGVKTVDILSPKTVPLQDYGTSGTQRFGTLEDMKDELQSLTLRKDRSWTFGIGKFMNQDQGSLKKAGEALQMQLDEQVNPEKDAWALGEWARNAGKSAVVSALTKSTIVSAIGDANAWLDNNKFPASDRHLYIGATLYNALRLSTEILAVDPLATKSLGMGIVGEVMSNLITKVPDSYLPTGVQFMLMHKSAGINPQKAETLRILTEVQGYDGAVLEGHHYYDAFVLKQKANGIYVAVLTANKVANPVITPTGASHAVGAVVGVQFRYTLDGSDPRYSASAVVYSGPVTLTSGQKINVAGFATANDLCVSDVVSATY